MSHIDAIRERKPVEIVADHIIMYLSMFFRLSLQESIRNLFSFYRIGNMHSFDKKYISVQLCDFIVWG